MIRISICDDMEADRLWLQRLCEEYLKSNEVSFAFSFFESGEEVLAYCGQQEKERIDLLFLDIEMSGMNGIEVKNRILKMDSVWRIVFVSSYQERLFDAFGLKTLGFIVKPAEQDKISKWIRVVLEELQEECYIELEDAAKIGREKVQKRL